jgi:hypothetical protein
MFFLASQNSGEVYQKPASRKEASIIYASHSGIEKEKAIASPNYSGFKSPGLP